jgi:DNA-binding GntR family transcriptional regulator
MTIEPTTSTAVRTTHLELWELVRAEIRNLIIMGEFAPGERLVESALAERFQVSRGPVRTALMELERVGLVNSVPRRGIQVATFDRSDIDELFDVITALERIAGREAAERASDEQIERL